ncbi:c-type cytochrome [Adhaeribacter radiodurans]|uniref:c-type cytochrome n=1 Tax=Adhaeribacter radiodurans TaxID=2745197 RepID=UPI001FE62405|nr:c-type cytochrome [Adhaeribacter radiodurans]
MLKPTLTKYLVAASICICGLTSYISVTDTSAFLQDGGRWVAPPTADKLKSPYPVEPLTLTQGEELFVMYCSPCHGENGYGDGAAGGAMGIKPANFHSPVVQKQSDGALFWKLSEGRGNMPPFKESLSEEQRWQLVAYLRKLGETVDNTAAGAPTSKPTAQPNTTPAKPSPETKTAATPTKSPEPKQNISPSAPPASTTANTPAAEATKAGPEIKTPTSLRPDIKVSHVMKIGPSAIRLFRHPQTGEFWYNTFEGDVYRIINIDKKDARTQKIFTAAEHGIIRLQGAVFHNNSLFLCGNTSVNNGKGTTGRMVRYDLGTGRKPTMTEVFNTVEYGTNATTFDHGWNALEVSPDGKFIYVNTGARTDHGEVQDNRGAYPNARDNALTAKIYRFPINAKNLLLPDDVQKLKADGYLFAEGVRNVFDMAFDPSGNLFGVSNSPDYDAPEDMFWLRQGHHYGFPWVFGGIDNPQQYPGWNPSPETDPFISKNAHAWIVKYFHDDPTFPKPPTGVKFTPGVQNLGPAANEYRDIASGKVTDGDLTGQAVSTFNAHSSPLALFFDTKKVLSEEFRGDGFVMRYTGGGRVGANNLLRKEGRDLLHLKLTYDPATDNYFVKTYRLVDNFNAPVDAVMVGNEVYIMEYAGQSDANIWKITLPKSSKASAQNTPKTKKKA